jgi:membrane protein DedA with SNARE-associated domain
MPIKSWLKALALPLTIIVFTLLYQILWQVLDWPTGEELTNLLTNFFIHYGLWLVFVCSILESAVIIGNYFPGGLIIFISVIACQGNIPKIILTVSIVSVGFFIGYLIDYLLGKYGWYKLLLKFGLSNQIETAKQKLLKHSFKAIISSYWEVNLASITATSAGILQMDFKKFLIESTLALIIWNIIWGALVGALGKRAIDIITNWKYALPILATWLTVLILKIKYDNRKNNSATTL